MSKLLIVDDSAELLEVMKNILERNGYTVKTLIRAKMIFIGRLVSFKLI